jgi:hypothetical protein
LRIEAVLAFNIGFRLTAIACTPKEIKFRDWGLWRLDQDSLMPDFVNSPRKQYRTPASAVLVDASFFNVWRSISASEFSPTSTPVSLD